MMQESVRWGLWSPPAPALQAVEAGVAVTLGASAPPTRWPAMAHAMLTLRLQPGAPLVPCGPVTLHTLTTRAQWQQAGMPVRALGLLLRPAAAACLLGAATGALTDRVLSWDDVAGAHEAQRLLHAVLAAANDAQRLAAMADSVQRALQCAQPQRLPALAHWLDAVGQHGTQAGPLLGIGPRQLQRRCQAVLGISPKLYQRLVRMQHTLAHAQARGGDGGAALALDCGYGDQSHLGLDLRCLAGAPLGRLLTEAQSGGAGWPLAVRRQLHHAGRVLRHSR